MFFKIPQSLLNERCFCQLRLNSWIKMCMQFSSSLPKKPDFHNKILPLCPWGQNGQNHTLGNKSKGLKARQDDYGLSGWSPSETALAQSYVTRHSKIKTHLEFSVTMTLYCTIPKVLSITSPLPPSTNCLHSLHSIWWAGKGILSTLHVSHLPDTK